jgi:DNA-binding NtrC family response regulator
MSDKILIIDDDRTHCQMVGMLILRKIGVKPLEIYNGRDALDAIKNDRNNNIRLVLLDLKMPGLDGFDVLREVKKLKAHLPVIILTGSQNLDDAIEATKHGALDFIRKPVETDRLVVSIRNALSMEALSEENSRLKAKQKHKANIGFDTIIGFHNALKGVKPMAQKAAQNDLPLLITGETGTGKEVFAKAIHFESDRKSKPFITLNCGAIPEKLIESILFGHEKGAFTGAIERSIGKFREADGGTIFLDEIGELPQEAQVKLLRVLQENEVEPIGLAKNIPVNVRVIAATNRNLATEVEEGRFREDLFFRLNVLSLELPPLRQRKDDIEDLTQFFIKKYAKNNETKIIMASEEFTGALKTYQWPGNIRQLENCLYRAIALHDSDKTILENPDYLGLDYTPKRRKSDAETHSARAGISASYDANATVELLDETGTLKKLSTLEIEIIQKAIKLSHNHMTDTAKSLGVAKSTLYRKLNEEIS